MDQGVFTVKTSASAWFLGGGMAEVYVEFKHPEWKGMIHSSHRRPRPGFFCPNCGLALMMFRE